MPSLRSSLVAAAAAVPFLLAAPDAAPAEAAFKEARFTATFEAKLKTTWSLPRHTTPQDCHHVRWRHGQGEETWSIRSRGKGAKVTATSSNASSVGWLKGWEIGGRPGEFAAGGLITRTSHLGEGWTPGDCDGTPGIVPAKKQDCGTLLPSYEISLSQKGDLISAMPMTPPHARNQKERYDECFQPMPDGVLEGEWPRVTARLSRAAVFGGGRTLTAKGRRTWRQPKHSASGTGTLSTTTTMRWTLTLKRAR